MKRGNISLLSSSEQVISFPEKRSFISISSSTENTHDNNSFVEPPRRESIQRVNRMSLLNENEGISFLSSIHPINNTQMEEDNRNDKVIENMNICNNDLDIDSYTLSFDQENEEMEVRGKEKINEPKKKKTKRNKKHI